MNALAELFPHVAQNWDGVLQATWETLYMVGASLFFSVLLGIPLGVLLVLTSPGHLVPLPWLNKLLGTLVNVFRSVPYIVLILWLLPVSRLLFGTSFGPTAAILSLVAGAAPFYARLVETALREVDAGVIEAARAMGASLWQIVIKVMIPEALPAMAAGVTVTGVGLVGYSAMAGVIGSGGLGAMAYNFGFNGFQNDTLFVATLLLILMVQLFQAAGDRIVRRLDKR